MGLKAIFVAAASWRRILGGAVAALVLLPVPAMAMLSFSSPWTGSPSVSGTPTPPVPTVSDSTSGQDDSLIINMGTYQGTTANSSITLTRQFQITGVSSQQVEFNHSAIDQFMQAGETLSLKVEDASGHVLFTPVTFAYTNPSSSLATVQDSELYKTILSKGTYTLVLNVAYKTNNKFSGSWGGKKKSAHRFVIEGL